MTDYTNIEVSEKVKVDVKKFIQDNLSYWKYDAQQYGEDAAGEDADPEEIYYLDITFGLNKDGKIWSYQTGDNSYTGGAYGYRYWAVTSVNEHTTAELLYEEVIEQWEDLIFY